MTINEALAHLGQMAVWHHAGMTIEVEIRDVRTSYGRIDFLVSPLTGAGQAWVARKSLTVAGL